MPSKNMQFTNKKCIGQEKSTNTTDIAQKLYKMY